MEVVSRHPDFPDLRQVDMAAAVVVSRQLLSLNNQLSSKVAMAVAVNRQLLSL
jgi:hypothetical protein